MFHPVQRLDIFHREVKWEQKLSFQSKLGKLQSRLFEQANCFYSSRLFEGNVLGETRRAREERDRYFNLSATPL